MTAPTPDEHDDKIAEAIKVVLRNTTTFLQDAIDLRVQLAARGLAITPIAPTTGAGLEPRGCPTPGACSCPPNGAASAGAGAYESDEPTPHLRALMAGGSLDERAASIASAQRAARSAGFADDLRKAAEIAHAEERRLCKERSAASDDQAYLLWAQQTAGRIAKAILASIPSAPSPASEVMPPNRRPKEPPLTESAIASNMLYDAADYFAETLTKADPQAWAALLTYLPKPSPTPAREREVEALEAACKTFWHADPYADEKSSWDDLPALCERICEADHQADLRNRMRAAIAALDAIRSRPEASKANE